MCEEHPILREPCSTYQVAILRTTESTKKEPDLKVIGMPLMAGVDFPQIEVLTFDGRILNWWSFWVQSQATIKNTPLMGYINKLMYLRDALKGEPAMYVIEGLTQMAKSYKEPIKYLKDCFHHPKVTLDEHVRSTLQARIMKANNDKELQIFMTFTRSILRPSGCQTSLIWKRLSPSQGNSRWILNR